MLVIVPTRKHGMTCRQESIFSFFISR